MGIEAGSGKDPGEVAQAADGKAVSRKPSQVEPEIGLETQVASGQTAEYVEADTNREVTNASTGSACRATGERSAGNLHAAFDEGGQGQPWPLLY